MVTMQRILLIVVLTLTSVEQSHFKKISFPATADQLLGKWKIIRWAGNIPIHEKRKLSPLPPFTFVRNFLGKLEFRMNISNPIGCIEFKVHLDETEHPGYYTVWTYHVVFIVFVLGKDFAVAGHVSKVRNLHYVMMMLMGRKKAPKKQILLFFENTAKRQGLNKTHFFRPRCDDSCGTCKVS